MLINKLIGKSERNRLVSWTLVNSLGKLKFSKSSYFYLVLVPILVKALEKIENPLNINWGGSMISIQLELPFTWYVFYFGAVAIAIGSIIYLLFCPEIIKKYRNYGEFLQAGESNFYLVMVAEKYKTDNFSLKGVPYIEERSRKEIEKIPANARIIEVFQKTRTTVDYKRNIKYEEDRKNSFNLLYLKVQYSKIVALWISFALYLIGFAGFAWVIIENIHYVVIHLILQN